MTVVALCATVIFMSITEQPDITAYYAEDITDGMVLVSEGGALLTVYSYPQRGLVPGMIMVETEFGQLLLDPDETVRVQD